MATALTQADTLARTGRAAEAAALLGRAAAAGDAAAAWQLATWYLIGQPIPRDLVRARAMLATARASGHADAARMEVALTANGTGAAPDWARARALLDAAATTDPIAAAQRQLLDAMALDAAGAPLTPPVGESLAGDRIVRFPGFATAAECAHLAETAADLLAPAMVFDPRTGRQVAHPVRTNHEAVIGPMRESLPVQAINRRIAAISGTDWRQGESLTVLRYTPGQQFRMHHDAINGARNQRVTTVLLYFNDGYAGGETVFPDHGVTVVPRAGDALLFQNMAGDRPDPQARHAGQPVRQGAKWLGTRWIRARPFSPWTGPEAA